MDRHFRKKGRRFLRKKKNFKGMEPPEYLKEMARKARVYTFFSHGIDFWPIAQWPEYLQEMALKRHKENHERYKLFQFFHGNGLDAVLAIAYLKMMDVRDDGRLIFEPYDATASKQFLQLIQQAKDGSLWKYNFFDMTLGMTHDKYKKLMEAKKFKK